MEPSSGGQPARKRRAPLASIEVVPLRCLFATRLESVVASIGDKEQCPKERFWMR